MNPSEPDDRCFLTIGIPVYNEAERLPTLFASLEKQDWSLFEVRFSDDGSTDRTEEVVRAFADRHPGRVFYQRHEKEGVGAMRNHIIPEAKGEYIWFCDGDDAIVADSVAAMARCLAGKTCDILAFRGPRTVREGTPADEIDDSPIEDSEPILLTRSQSVQYVKGGTWAKILRVRFLLDNKIRFPSERISQDRIFTIEATCRATTTLFWNVRPYRYILRGDSATKLGDNFIRDMAIGIAHLERQADEFPEFRREIEYQVLLARLYESQRVDEGAPAFREQYSGIVWNELRDFIAHRNNPLLSGIFALSTRNRKLLSRNRKQEARIRKQEEHIGKLETRIRKLEAGTQKRDRELTAVRQSLSWRLTAPLRAVLRPFSARNP